MICCHKSCLLLLLSTATTRSTFPEQQQSADGQASLLSPTTTADNVDTKPVVLGKASSALEGEELTVRMAKAHVHYALDTTHSTSAGPPSLSCRPLTLPPLNLPGGVSKYHSDYFRCEDGESASIIRTCMEQDCMVRR